MNAEEVDYSTIRIKNKINIKKKYINSKNN